MSHDAPIRLAFNRRSLLGGGVVALGAAVGGCAPGQATAATGSGQTSATGNMCLLTPQSTEGPYWFDPNLERADVRENRAGLPLALEIRVLEGADCSPIEGAHVHIWHCDAQGAYSGYDGQGPDGSTEGEAFLRGWQPTGADGVARLTTIYPGWYRGRTARIHVKVFLDRSGTEANVLTCQLFFPDALSEYIYENAPDYRRTEDRDTLNAMDGIASGQGWSTFGGVSETADGYLMRVTLGVDRSATSQERGREPGRPGGPPPGGRPPGPPPGGGRPGQGGPGGSRLTPQERAVRIFPGPVAE